MKQAQVKSRGCASMWGYSVFGWNPFKFCCCLKVTTDHESGVDFTELASFCCERKSGGASLVQILEEKVNTCCYSP